MDCYEVQEHLTEVVDNRPLEPSRKRELDEHLSKCAACIAAFELARATKRAVARLARPHAVPTMTAASVRAMMEQEDLHNASLRPAGSAGGVWQFARRRPIWTIASLAAAAVVVLFLFPRADGERRFNESPAAFVQQAILNYDALVRDTQTVQFRTSDPAALRDFFQQNGVTYEVQIPVPMHAALVGGSISVRNAARVAHVIYQCGKHFVCLCQVPMSDVCPTNKTALSDSARSCVCNGKWYWYREGANRNVGLWKYDEMVCAATSDCEPGEIAALFTESH